MWRPGVSVATRLGRPFLPSSFVGVWGVFVVLLQLIARAYLEGLSYRKKEAEGEGGCSQPQYVCNHAEMQIIQKSISYRRSGFHFD